MVDNVAAASQRSSPTLTHAATERFLATHGKRGPHDYARQVRVSRPFHRLFSVKSGMRAIGVDSPLKAEAVLRAESDPTIVSLVEQPMRIPAPLLQHPRSRLPSVTTTIGH